MTAYLYDVTFWVAVNAVLTAAVIGLVLIRYTMTRATSKPQEKTPTIDLTDEIQYLKDNLEKGDYRTAVTKTFSQTYRRVCGFYGVETKTSTVLETLSDEKIPENVMSVLLKMYELYEPVKYGLAEPSKTNVEEFLRLTERLAAEVSKP